VLKYFLNNMHAFTMNIFYYWALRNKKYVRLISLLLLSSRNRMSSMIQVFVVRSTL
jgi:hypothetical protein